MNASRTAAIGFLCFVAASQVAGAGDAYYECTVVTAAMVTEQGTLAPHWTNKSMVGVKFAVDRITGRIIGGPLDNANLRTEVIDKGSREMSFQVLSRSMQRTHVTHIEIHEFASRVEKPFVGTTTLYHPGVYSGLCK